MKPYEVRLEYRKIKYITVVAENELEAETAALDLSETLIDVSELEVVADASNYGED